MKKEMLINVLQPEECRIAIVENGVLEELYVERTSQESYVGNIYKGRIVNIEPSIQAAFVDFGIGRNGFLHISDVDPAYYKHLDGGRGDRGDRDRDRGGRDRDRDRGGRGGRGRGRRDDRSRREGPPAPRAYRDEDYLPPEVLAELPAPDAAASETAHQAAEEPPSVWGAAAELLGLEMPPARERHLDPPAETDAELVADVPPPPPVFETIVLPQTTVTSDATAAPAPEPQSQDRGRGRGRGRGRKTADDTPTPKVTSEPPVATVEEVPFGAGVFNDLVESRAEAPPPPVEPPITMATPEPSPETATWTDDATADHESGFAAEADLPPPLDAETLEREFQDIDLPGEEEPAGEQLETEELFDMELEDGVVPQPRVREPRDRGDRGRGRGDRDRGGRGFRGGKPGGGRFREGRPKPLIQDVFKRGQEVIVQVIKEGIGTKGPTLSTYVSIAGRYLVLMPGLNRIGVSRKIQDEEARRRLKEILTELQPPKGIGFIIRTAGIDRNKRELQNDLAYLLRLWQVMVRRIRKVKSPAEIYQESDMITRTIRDTFTNDIDTIHVDEPNAFAHAQEFLQIVMPRYSDRIKHYDDTEPMFHKYRIEDEIIRIQQKKIPLPMGGSIVIEQTEALVAIDVNSGNFRAENNAEETAYQMNLQAAKEIARQLRLRDLGGVIVNDFIDMRSENHKRGVEKAMRDALKRDRARTKILRISQFGLIEMTRQRIRPSLKRSVYHECPSCNGNGLVKSVESMSIDVMRLMQLAAHREGIHRMELRVHADVANYLLNRRRKEIAALEEAGELQVAVYGVIGASPELMQMTCFDRTNSEVKFPGSEPVRLPERRARR